MNLLKYYKESSEMEVLARTLLGEAKICSPFEKGCVGSVIKNRVYDPRGRWGITYKDVCLQAKQFSCWNSNDPARRIAMDARLGARLFEDCLGLAFVIIFDYIKDNTDGANHYHDKTISAPVWAKNMTKTLETEHFIFYRG